MRLICTGTLAALMLGAAIASSQTPAGQGGQTQPGQKTLSGGQTQSGGQQSDPQRKQADQNQTYRGYLRGSATSGWTISPIGNTAGTAGSAAAGGAATAVSGGAGTRTGAAGTAVTYDVAPSQTSKTDLASMANQCVEIVGSLSPETGTASGSTQAGATATNEPAGDRAGAAMRAGGEAAAGVAGPGAEANARSTTSSGGGTSRNRTLTVTSIRPVQGGCTQ